MLDQVREFRPRRVGVADERAAGRLRELEAEGTEIVAGEHAAREIAGLGEADLVVNGLVGSVGLTPTLAALERGTPVALANKEVLWWGASS